MFKNLKMYSFIKPVGEMANVLHAVRYENFEEFRYNLESNQFVGCPESSSYADGWCAPNPESDQLYHHSSNVVLLCNKIENKILPDQVINQYVEDKCDDIERRTSSRPVGKYKQSVKEDVIALLLPRAFSKISKVYGYIDFHHEMIVIDTSSNTVADDFIGLLRTTLDSLPIAPLRTNTDPSTIMTSWVNEEDPVNPPFTLGSKCELKEPDGQGVVSIRSKEVKDRPTFEYLEDGMYVSKLEMQWGNKATFVLCDDVSLRQLKMDGLEENPDPEDSFSSEFFLIAGLTSLLIYDLTKEFGGKIKMKGQDPDEQTGSFLD